MVSKKFRAQWQLVDVVYVDKVSFSLRLTHSFGRDSSRTRCQQICPTQRGRNLLVSLVVVIGREGVIAHVVTLGADDSKKFLEFTQTKVIPSHDKQRIILMDNVPFHRSCENTTSF